LADPDTYSRVTLKFETPYARRDGDHQTWQLKFSLSGDTLTSSADAEEVALALADPVLAITTTATSLTGWLYYPTGSNVNTYQGSYDYGDMPGTTLGYVADEGYDCQLEVCALAKAHVGVSSKGKATYLFKHIHDVWQQGDSAGVLNPVHADNFAAWSTGLGSHDLVTVSPTTGDASAAWELDAALYTRQLRRGYLPKA
jgi:hypothetical protein